MRSGVVSKFGGSSLADSNSVGLVQNIVAKNQPNIVVVSAPGKRNSFDTKITDMLIAFYDNSMQNDVFDDKLFQQCMDRYREIAESYQLDIEPIIDKMSEDICNNFYYDYVVSRGEYLMAKVMAHILGYQFVDSKELLIMRNGNIDRARTAMAISQLDKDQRYCIPGFYGSCEDNIVTLPRGGSDLTGAIVSVLGGYCEYENWTDVGGVYDMDPNSCADAFHYDDMSYTALNRILRGGAQVLQEDCINWLAGSGVVTKVCNTFEPNSQCTIIHDEQ